LARSHVHAGHVGGAAAVRGGGVVAAACVSPVADPAAGGSDTYGALARAGVPVRAARTGGEGVAGTVSWQVLLAGAGTGANDASVGLRARTAGLAVVLLGALE